MSELRTDIGILNPKLPSIVTGHPLLKVTDVSKIDKVVTKIFRAIVDLQLDVFGDGSPMHIFINHYPTLAELVTALANPDFDFQTFSATYPEITALASYLMLDQNSAFPANFPTAFRWLYNFSLAEKVEFAKSYWRTRNFHSQLPQFFGAMHLITIFAFADMFAVCLGKFRKIAATCFADNKLQIPFDALDEKTWKAFMYRTRFDIDTVYLAVQRDNLFQHLFLTWDTQGFQIPEESIKLGRLLCGKFKNFALDDNIDIAYDYPVDLIIREPNVGDPVNEHTAVFGDDYTTYIQPMLVKLKSYLSKEQMVTNNIEYNDKFYEAVYGPFMKMLSPSDFNCKLLTDWQDLPVPWFQIFAGFHFSILDEPEIIFRAWNDESHASHSIPDLAEDAGEMLDMFTREQAGLPEMLPAGQDAWSFLHALIPYGYDEESWWTGLTFGWMYLQRFLGGNRLTSELQINYEWEDIISYLYYNEYYDSQGNLLFKICNNGMSAFAENTVSGWICTTDDAIFNDIYKPYVINSAGYGNIAEDLTGHVLDAGDLVATNLDTYYPKLMRQFKMIKYQSPVFQTLTFKQRIYQIINPYVAPKVQSQTPALKKVENDILQSQAKAPERVLDPIIPKGDDKKLSNQDIKKIDTDMNAAPSKKVEALIKDENETSGGH